MVRTEKDMKFLLCILGKWPNLSLLGEIISYFTPGATEEVLIQIFGKF